MKMSGEEVIPASRETVWKALNDPAILKQSIPGCQSIVKHSETEMEARVVVKLGPLKVGFTGIVNLTDLDPPNGYRISGEGKGGLAGSASGGANVKLEALPEGTRLLYDVDAQVTGKLASLGARFIEPASRSLASQFFAKFATLAAKMEPGAAAPKPRKPAKKPAKKAVKKPARKPARKPAKKPAKKKR